MQLGIECLTENCPIIIIHPPFIQEKHNKNFQKVVKTMAKT